MIGGSKCLFAPIDVFACDHGEESIFPIETLARTYVIIPPAQYPDGAQENPQVVRVIASEANTALTFNPDQPVAKLLANVGDFVELPPGTAKFVVTADKRVLVSQFMASSGITGSDCVGISIYGLQTAGSYWYPGGLDLAPIPPG